MNDFQVTRGKGLMEKFLAKKRVEMANKLIPENLRKGKILDVGCGKRPFFLLNTKFNGKYGIDLVVDNDFQNIELYNLNIIENSLPFESNYFNVVTMLAVLEHINLESQTQILKKVRRVLRPGGRLIITTPCLWSDKLLKVMAKMNLVSSEEINDHKGVLNQDALVSKLKNAKFRENKIETGYFEFFLNSWAYAEKIKS